MVLPPKQQDIVVSALVWLLKYGDGSAECCNLYEQLHTLIGCKECLERWDGTRFIGVIHSGPLLHP